VSQHADRIYVPGKAYVYLGPVGSTAPVDAALAPVAPMVEVGYFSQDSLKFATSPKIDVTMSHQAPYPTRRTESTSEATVEVALQEWSSASFITVYGGGSVVAITPASTPPTYMFTPPDIGGRQEVMGIVRIIDGLRAYQLIIPRCMQISGVSHDLKKTNESALPMQLSVLGSSIGAPFYWISNDAAMAPA
jgi:hypothetical protein